MYSPAHIQNIYTYMYIDLLAKHPVALANALALPPSTTPRSGSQEATRVGVGARPNLRSPADLGLVPVYADTDTTPSPTPTQTPTFLCVCV